MRWVLLVIIFSKLVSTEGISNLLEELNEYCLIGVDPVEFTHILILHHAFSSWIEKTMAKTVHCLWENRFVFYRGSQFMIEVYLKDVRFSLNSYRFWFEHVLMELIVKVLQIHCSELHVFIHSVKI